MRVYFIFISFLVCFMIGCSTTKKPEPPKPTQEKNEVRNYSDDSIVNHRGNSTGNIVNTGLVAHQGDWIYYVNPSPSDDDDKLYKIRTDGTQRQVVE